MRKLTAPTLLVAALFAAGCPKQAPAPEVPAAPPPAPPPVDLAALDRNVNPCDDFYAFACGGWIQKTEIPADRPGWFRGFSEIQERNQKLLREILDTAAAGKLDSPYADKLGTWFASCMDEAKLDKASLQTLAEETKAIDAIDGPPALARKVARLQKMGVDAFFHFASDQDFRDATQVIGSADQGGIGLPDRDYYLKDDAKSQEIRANYVKHVARMLELSGVPADQAAKQAATVMEIETALAKASMSRVDRRDPYKIYHRIERKGLEGLAPTFDWNAYFDALGQPDLEKINVATPEFFSGWNEVLKNRPLADLQTYLRWQLLDAAAPGLSEPFVQQDFAFRSQNLTGEKEILPRWKRCVDSVDQAMGEALARPFVAATFGSKGKEMSQELVRGIEDAFQSNLGNLAWMDDATKAQALDKLHAVYNKIGYPDRWRNYDKLEVKDGAYLRNRFNAAIFESNRDLNKIGKPVDRAEWFMSPPTVNAYYNPLLNEMVFPAGILQSPFFNARAEEATNAGGIGMVMGHELTHGFDDKGRLFDAKGNLREWWTPEVSKAYESKAQCVVDQYAGYQVLGQNLNGELTLGENIADIGGLKLAWDAFQASRKGAEAKPAEGGFTEGQKFFLSFAQSWCAKRRDEYARMLVTVDPHSPPEYRVNGVVANLPAFGETFQCPAGSAMAPAKRCAVW